jgi:hypothetical protein
MRGANKHFPHPPRNGTRYAGAAGSPMRKLARRAIGGLAAAALMAFGASAVLTAVPAAAATHGTAASSCTVRWTGMGDGQLWIDPRNWSTGKVPGPSDNVCIISSNINTDVTTTVPIRIRSLVLGVENGINLQGTASKPVTATVATTVTMTRLKQVLGSFIQMENATLKAGQIISHLGTIFTAGTCHVISSHIVFADQSDLQAFNGTATLSSLPELSNGTLTGVGILADHATVVLPGDITHLASANVRVDPNSAIDDPAGHNALSGLTSVDARSALADANDLTLTGSSFTDDGLVDFGPGTMTIPGPFTQAQGTLNVEPGGVLSASSVTIDHGARYFGQGTIATDLVNDGSVAAVGTAHVTGNYTQAPGASLTTGFGNVLRVAGAAKLAGSVSAAKPLGQTGDKTQLITFKSLSLMGAFTSHPLGLRLLTRFNEIDGLLFPQIAASPTTVSAGQTVTVRGGGYTFDQVASIFLDHARGKPLATQVIDAFGNIKVPVTIPASVAAGPHRLIAVESDGNRATATFTVR